MHAKNPDRIKLDEVTETLNNVKTKLKIQLEQRELYEQQHIKMMEILNITRDNRMFTNILPAIKELKKSHEQNETELYSEATNVLDSYSSEDDITIKVDP